MSLLLRVPYEEKDIVKKLGAWWNPEIKRWYVRDKKDYPKFRKWITDKQEFTIVCDYIYIVEGKQSCYRCGESTRVIGFGEVGSPFWVDSKEVASQLKLYRIPLKYDLVLDFMEVGWGSEDWIIKKYGKITEINL